MNKKALLFGSLPAVAVATGLFFANSSTDDGIYSQRSVSSSQNELAEGASEYYQMIKGDYTKEQYDRAKLFAGSINQDRTTYSWTDQGPDNIGGRTRAILIDKDDINHIYAGSVSGGLFESFDRANTWQKVQSFTENLAVSSITQTADGTIYVGTGHVAETINGINASGAFGYGVYRQNGDGWALIPTTENYTFVNEVVSDTVNNVIWIASNQGLKKYTAATSSLESITSGLSPGACTSLQISPDGNLIVAATAGSRTQISTNGGASFIDVTDDDVTSNPIALGSSRIEYAISHEKVDGKYRVYASAANDYLTGIWRSTDDGLNWERIAPAYDGVTPGAFAPFATGVSGQGTYDNIITVVPEAPDKIIVGGVNCYSWSTSGNWEQISQSFANPISPVYVHADNHELKWDKTGRLYIGNDGGIGISDNAGTATPTFYHANRGYNVSQFFDIGFSAHGDVMGGLQDNGTKANYHDNATFQEFDRLNRDYFGGDGFSSDMSFINRNIIFSSLYYSSGRRSTTRGEEGQLFFPESFADGTPCTPGGAGGGGCGTFFTHFKLWENPNDLASTDSIRVIPQEPFEIGDTVVVNSSTSETTINYISPINIVFDSTLHYDPALTYEDTIAFDQISEGEFNLGLLNWEFIDGASEISVGDSILIIGTETNDTIIVDSLAFKDHYLGTNPLKPGKTIDMVYDTVLFDISWDTLLVQDPFQSWFALDMGSSNGIWMTRNALRFATPENWFLAMEGIAGNVLSIEFSKDGNYLFVGTSSGRLYRYTGFNEIYSATSATQDSTVGGITYGTITNAKGDSVVTQFTQIGGSLGGPITDIAAGPIGNPEHIVVTLGGFSGSQKVRESINATGASPTFTNLGFPNVGPGDEAGGIPVYSAVIDRDDPNIILVGTEFGVYATENATGAGTEWTNVSGDFGDCPVHDIGQNWRTWDEGCKRPGEIYIGTHGRGIWSTDAFLGLPNQNDNLDKNKFIPTMNLYPNPLKDAGTVEFELTTNEDVVLQIFNLSGQVIREVNAKNLQAGANQIAFDASDLSKGTYILRLSSESMNETTKFIKY